MRKVPLGEGRRRTEPRRLVWQAISDLGPHCTADEIAARLQIERPGFSRSTVYRALEVFTGSGALRSVRLGAGPTHYEIAGAQHQHAICEQCHGILHVEDSLLRELESHLSERHNFRPLRTELLVIGRCEDCSGDNKGSATPSRRNIGHVHHRRS